MNAGHGRWFQVYSWSIGVSECTPQVDAWAVVLANLLSGIRESASHHCSSKTRVLEYDKSIEALKLTLYFWLKIGKNFDVPTPLYFNSGIINLAELTSNLGFFCGLLSLSLRPGIISRTEGDPYIWGFHCTAGTLKQLKI